MKEITLEATVQNIRTIIDWIDGELEQVNCPLKAQMQIDVAADEIMANISSYAYAPDTGNVTVGFSYDESSQTAAVTFTDYGIPFDPLKKEEPDVTLGAEERAIGGLGIFLVRKTMDEVSYHREGEKNILTIRKKFAGA